MQGVQGMILSYRKNISAKEAEGVLTCLVTQQLL